MNAIKSITPILLTKKIEPPSMTHAKAIFLIQEKIAEYSNLRKSTHLEAEVP
jgi:hypothetical protein